MRIALVNPPQAHFTQPLLALPSLAAYLRAKGLRDVHVFDASIESYDEFLSGPRLLRSVERVRAGEGLASLESRERLRYSEMERYQALSEIELVGDEVAASIDEAKRVLRTPELFYDYERYLRAGRTVEQALRLFSAEYAPTRLAAHGFVMRGQIESSNDVLRAIGDERENPYVEWLRESFLPRLAAVDPDVVGLSVTFGSQAIPALTLAKQIKAWKPECHVTLGGGLLAYVGRKLSKRPELWSVIDSMILLEGERPLHELCESLAERRDLGKVPNLIYRDASGEVRATPEAQPLDIKTLPTPEFDGLPLGLYLSPEPVLPLAITRGCYWGKCVFCTLYTVIGPGYRGRSIEQTVEDVRTLKERHSTRHFYMVIEDLPPNMAKALPRAILDAGLDIDWWCDARLEHDVFDRQVCEDLAASGCKRIAFGYESASRRVLDRMCKGIDPARSLELVRRVHDAGISVTLYVMVGFPTETRDEARLTLDTILANRDAIQEVSVRVFYLDETSEIFRRAREFDIAEIYPNPDADLQVYYDFKTSSGMSRREARDAYLDFTRALRSHFPVFQNTNLLYHELKSHYFLYLAKWGTFDRLRAEVLERQVSGAGDRPRRRPALRERALRFDRAEIDERLAAIQSGHLRPRYQTDLVTDEERARFDREIAPLAASPCVLAYDPSSGEVQALSPAAADLLARCDGDRSAEQIVEIVPAEHRDDARRCIDQLASAGLLETSPTPSIVR
ncbi:MAG TPA: radical SAM protein [Planctomycetota bacterium]|nr:radical SAM protein [Planctomycetota bacterium]